MISLCSAVMGCLTQFQSLYHNNEEDGIWRLFLLAPLFNQSFLPLYIILKYFHLLSL